MNDIFYALKNKKTGLYFDRAFFESDKPLSFCQHYKTEKEAHDAVNWIGSLQDDLKCTDYEVVKIEAEYNRYKPVQYQHGDWCGCYDCCDRRYEENTKR